MTRPLRFAISLMTVAVTQAGCIPTTTPTTAKMLPRGASEWGISLDAMTQKKPNGKDGELGTTPTLRWRYAPSDDLEVGIRGLLGTAAPFALDLIALEGDAKVRITDGNVVAIALDPTAAISHRALARLWNDSGDSSYLHEISMCGHVPLLVRLGGESVALAASAGPSLCTSGSSDVDYQGTISLRTTAGVEVRFSKDVWIRPEIIYSSQLNGHQDTVGGGLLLNFGRFSNVQFLSR